MARGQGGSASHRPAQDSARKNPMATDSEASAGHSRSQNRLPRARLIARPSISRGEGGRA